MKNSKKRSTRFAEARWILDFGFRASDWKVRSKIRKFRVVRMLVEKPFEQWIIFVAVAQKSFRQFIKRFRDFRIFDPFLSRRVMRVKIDFRCAELAESQMHRDPRFFSRGNLPGLKCQKIVRQWTIRAFTKFSHFWQKHIRIFRKLSLIEQKSRQEKFRLLQKNKSVMLLLFQNIMKKN